MQTNQETHAYSITEQNQQKKTRARTYQLSVWKRTKNPCTLQQNETPQHCRSRRQRTSYCPGHQRWVTLFPHTHTQLRLARTLARTTRTRNKTKTDYGQLRRLFRLNLRYTYMHPRRRATLPPHPMVRPAPPLWGGVGMPSPLVGPGACPAPLWIGMVVWAGWPGRAIDCMAAFLRKASNV